MDTRQWRWQTVLRIARISSPWGSISAEKPSKAWQALCVSYLCLPSPSLHFAQPQKPLPSLVFCPWRSLFVWREATLYFPRSSPLAPASMGILSKIEDRPTPAAVYNWRVYLSAIVASFGSCMIGYTTSFIGTTVALDSFGDAFGFQNMSTAESTLIKANVVSLFQAGAFFGSPMAYATSHYLGRVKSLWISASVFIIGAAITFASITGSLGPLYAGRVICGLGVGGCTMVVSISMNLRLPMLVSVLTRTSRSLSTLRRWPLQLFVDVLSVPTNLAGSSADSLVSGSTME